MVSGTRRKVQTIETPATNAEPLQEDGRYRCHRIQSSCLHRHQWATDFATHDRSLSAKRAQKANFIGTLTAQEILIQPRCRWRWVHLGGC